MRQTRGGTNPGHARSINRRVILETIRLHGPISRADIARRTALSVQTVSIIAEQLTGSGLLLEKGLRKGSRGAPALDLTINPEGGFTFGISLDHRRLVCVLVDLAGRLQRQIVTEIAGLSPEAVINLIERAVRSLAKEQGAEPARLWGAGVVMPMLFENERPISFGPTSMPAWQDYPITERLRDRLGLPVLVENDATAAAVGEHLYGVGRRLSDFFYVYIGAGVGGGMILSGHPYRGSAGRAGELGHVVVVPGGRACACGNRGCLERYASLSAAQATLEGVPEREAVVDPSVLARSAHLLGGWLEEAADHCQTAFRIVANLLDPQAIVVGGIIPEPLLRGLLERLRDARAGTLGSRPILQAEVDLETPALGGAALPLFEGLSPTIALLRVPRNQGTGMTPSAPRAN